jgi:hypothetical protein
MGLGGCGSLAEYMLSIHRALVQLPSNTAPDNNKKAVGK